MVLLGGGDQQRVGVHPDHDVAAGVQHSAHPAGAAAGVEDPRARGDQRIEQPGLTAEVGPVGRQPPEPLDVPAGMALRGVRDPTGGSAHGPTLEQVIGTGRTGPKRCHRRSWNSLQERCFRVMNKLSGMGGCGSQRCVDEAGSLGEASVPCGAGAGEGITSGAAGWVGVLLPPGRYELLCNLPNHYPDGMYAEASMSAESRASARPSHARLPRDPFDACGSRRRGDEVTDKLRGTVRRLQRR